PRARGADRRLDGRRRGAARDHGRGVPPGLGLHALRPYPGDSHPRRARDLRAGRPPPLRGAGVTRRRARALRPRRAIAPIDPSRVRTVPLARRPSKVLAAALGGPVRAGLTVRGLLDGLPDILAAHQLREAAVRIARAMLRERLPFGRTSILAAAARAGTPVTVHVAVGTDIIHMHPSADGAAVGLGSLRDFHLLAGVVARLAGGVYMNLGSAVVLPEVF